MSLPLLDRILSLVPPDGVIGLGEPSHGTAEAFAAKMDLICEIARRGSLGMLAFEDSYMVGTCVDQALAEGSDPGMPWADAASMWRTETIVHGMRRLAGISAGLPPDARPRFLGVDSKRPDLAARLLLESGEEFAERADDLGDMPTDELGTGGVTSLRRLAEREPLEQLSVAEVEEAALRRAQSADPELAAASRQLLRRIDAYHRDPDLGGLHRRERHMAHTLLENLPPRGITVVWAHTEHIARNPENVGGPSMGQVSAEQLGPRYAAIGIACGEGTCRAVDPSTGDPGYRSVALPPARPDTTDAMLARSGDSFVTSEDFQHPGPRRFVGWCVDSSLPARDRSTFEVDRPSSDVDAWAYLPQSTADAAWDGPAQVCTR